jgi:ribosome-associated toxin RatA of RatAB toxin-antitoxin module
MALIQRSALVEYSVDQMFDLVNDIEKYPEFMRGCVEAEVVSKNDKEIVGRLCLSKAGIRQVFTTKNLLNRPHSIEMQLVEGKFKTFSSRWCFEALQENACKVSLHMEFEFDYSLADFAAEKLLSSSANGLVDSLVSRAKLTYG